MKSLWQIASNRDKLNVKFISQVMAPDTANLGKLP